MNLLLLCQFFAPCFCFLISSGKNQHICTPVTCVAKWRFALYVIKKVKLTKPWMLARSIPWSIFHLENLKLLGRWNGLFGNTCWVNTCYRYWHHLLFDNYVWLCNYTFKTIISYHKWLGGLWPIWFTPLSRQRPWAKILMCWPMSLAYKIQALYCMIKGN